MADVDGPQSFARRLGVEPVALGEELGQRPALGRDPLAVRVVGRGEPRGPGAGGAGAFRIAVTSDDGEVVLVTGADVATVGEVGRARTGDAYRLPVTLTDEGTAAFADEIERVGALDDPDAHRLRTYFRGELLSEAGLGHDLADAVKTGDWAGEFLFHVTARETAARVRTALKTETAGATKTPAETETTAESG